MRAYHFLPRKFGLDALRNKRIKIARLAELNDPFELAPPGNSQASHRNAFRKMKDQIGQDRGLLCFTKNWHNPLMWSHYAEKHKGIALGFDVNEVFFEINYRKSRLLCDWDRFSENKNYALKIMNSVFRTKTWDWRYEQELRALVSLDHETNDNGLYFFNFSEGIKLKEVIIGAHCEISQNELQSALDGYSNKPNLLKARLAFRDFRVVRQQDFHQRIS